MSEEKYISDGEKSSFLQKENKIRMKKLPCIEWYRLLYGTLKDNTAII